MLWINSYFGLSNKTISKLFTLNSKRPSRTCKSMEEIKALLLKEAVKLDLYNPDIWNDSEFKEFVWWMAISKLTHRTKPFFDYNNEAIKILSDVLGHYSHSKLTSFYKNMSICKLFKYYIENCFQEIIKNFPEFKRNIYTKAAVDMVRMFQKFLHKY